MMNMDRRTQVEALEETKRREASQKLSDSIPEGAFQDSPEAEGYDKNGKVDRKSASTFTHGGMDLGRFPPNG